MPEKSYREWVPTQSYLLPPSPTEWLPDGHLAYFVLDVVRQLDLSGIEESIQLKDPRGERPYNPRMMVALFVYAYSTGVYSARRIARGTYEDVALRVIAAGEHPHFTTINQFRLEFDGELAGLFRQGYQMCRRAGLVKLGLVALDGARILALASKHKAMSYARMNAEEKRIQQQIEAMFRRAQQVNEEEDRRYGERQDEEDLPAEMQIQAKRLERLKAAKAELEREAAEDRAKSLRDQAAAQEQKSRDESLPEHERRRAATRARKSRSQAQRLTPENADTDEQPELPLNRVPTEPDGKPKPYAQRNFTDPESRIMVRNGAFVQAYNAQIVVDAECQVIVAHGVSNLSPDQPYFIPLVDRIFDVCEQAPGAIVADSGYYSMANTQHAQSRSIDPYIAVGRESTTSGVPDPPTTEALQAKADMRQKLKEPTGRAIYARRKAIVEPVLGQIEQARGFRRFSRRGQNKAGCEWGFVCFIHNLLKLFRYAAGPPNGPRLARSTG